MGFEMADQEAGKYLSPAVLVLVLVPMNNLGKRVDEKSYSLNPLDEDLAFLTIAQPVAAPVSLPLLRADRAGVSD